MTFFLQKLFVGLVIFSFALTLDLLVQDGKTFRDIAQRIKNSLSNGFALQSNSTGEGILQASFQSAKTFLNLIVGSMSDLAFSMDFLKDPSGYLYPSLLVLTPSISFCLLFSWILMRVYKNKICQQKDSLNLLLHDIPVRDWTSDNLIPNSSSGTMLSPQKEEHIQRFLSSNTEQNLPVDGIEAFSNSVDVSMTLKAYRSQTSLCQLRQDSGEGQRITGLKDDRVSDVVGGINQEIGDGHRESPSKEESKEYAFIKDIPNKCAFSSLSIYKRVDDGRRVAVRSYDSSSEVLFNAELEIFKTVKECPFVVQMFESFKSEIGHSLVLDYVYGGSLLNLVQKKGNLNTEDTRFYVAEILLALDFLHNKGIVLRDLKIEKVMLDFTGHVVLVHFHAAALETASLDSSSEDNYALHRAESPESLRTKVFGSQSDVWALGILMFELLLGRNPFLKATTIATEKAILHGVFPMGCLRNVEQVPATLMKSMLKKNPESRITVKEMFRHDYFNSVDWTEMESKRVPPPFRPRMLS